MNIFGDKVVLRAIEKYDNKVLRDIINDPETEKMLGGISFPVSEDSQEKWFSSVSSNPSVLRCIIADKSLPDEALGTIVLSDIDHVNGTAQIHIKLIDCGKRRCGYGYDSVTAITDYAFNTLRLHCIYADIISFNEASQNLFLKCGYHKDGVLRDRIFKLGTYWDVIVYSKQNDKN